MSQVSVFQCDGPSCLEADDDSLDETSLQEAGWLIVTMYDPEDETERVAHLHSFACLAAWATESADE